MNRKSASLSAFFTPRVLIAVLFCLTGIAVALFALNKAWAQSGNKASGKEEFVTQGEYRGLLQVVHFDVSPPLSTIRPIPPGPGKLRENEEQDVIPRLKAGMRPVIDPVVQSAIGHPDQPAISPPLISFNGPPNSSGVYPPDPNGDVGPNHVVVMCNLSFQVFTKSGASVFGPAANNTLWSGFGGACETQNAGDPVVIYDQLADRWLLTQFTSTASPTYFECVALSQTSNPAGPWYRWAISTGNNFPDYPKAAMWPDAYYFSTREFAGGTSFAGIGAYALNRAQALAGNPNPQIIAFLAPPTPAYNVGDGLLPADLDGMTQPPAGSPEFYVGSMDPNGGYGAPQNALTIWKFVANFANPPSSTFTLTNTVTTAPFNSILALCGGTRNCVPQPSTTVRLDHQGYRQRPLHRAAYRNFGDHEAIVTNQSVSAGTGPSGEVSGIRWWELRSPNSSPFIFQQGTFAPGLTDGIHRWFGSIAINGQGDMALGYSASNGTTVFPSIYYTARHPADPLGTMPLGEGVIVNGTGSQTGTASRWGDYSSMLVDPVDDTTFWYVNEWVPTTSATGWQLRIGAFSLVPTPNLVADTATIIGGSCYPPNGTINPGETVTVRFCVRNGGDLSTTNTVGTLQNTGGVTNASGPQTFGAIAPGATVCRSFTFTASGTCGGTITPSIQLQDGTSNQGTATYPPFTMGSVSTAFTENFDGVTPPALPSGWTADQGTNAGGFPLWVTSNSGTPSPAADTAPNAAFSQDPSNLLDNRIYTPTITYTAGSQLTFKQNYDIEEQSAVTAYDAGVLEISSDGGSTWQDITAAGGTFATGGYNHTFISTGFMNPIAGARSSWSGVSGGFVPVAVNLPNSLAGQPVKFRWRMCSDNSVSHAGLRVDTVAISQRNCATSCTAPTALSAVSRKTHTGVGAFDIDLPLSGTPGIECRTTGGTNDHTVIVTFGSAVSVIGTPQAQVASGTGTIGSGGVSNGGIVTISGNTVTIPLTNVTNAQTITIRLNGVSNGTNTGNMLIPMSVLAADTNGNAAVNSGDIAQTKARLGQTLTQSSGNFRSDVNANGAINSGDVSQIKSLIGTGLP